MSTPERTHPPWGQALAMAALAAAVLTVLSWHHPGLRLVDFLGFSGRGDRLLRGEDLVHPLYPIGYPLVVGVGQAIFEDPIGVGRALSIASGALLVGVASRWLGPAAGLWMLAQPGLLTYGATEGTDLPAVALGVAALWARTDGRPATSGALAGLAALTRYTSVALLPLLLLPTPRGPRPGPSLLRLVGAFVVATSPHWAVALTTGASLLPDQSGNFTIAASAPVHGLGWDTFARMPGGLRAALPFVFSGPGAGVGLAAGGLAGVLAWRRRSPLPALDAGRLFGWGLLHLGLVSTAFANVRLVLPARLAFALGVPLLLGSRPRVLAALALVLGAWTLPPAWTEHPSETRLAGVVDLLESLDGPLATSHFLTTDPWVHRRSGPRLEAGTPIREVGGDPRTLDAATVARHARARGYGLVVVDLGRVHRTYPGLTPLLDTPPALAGTGLRSVGRVPGYRVFALQTAPETP